MKMLSLFSGIGGIDLAASWVGIETVAFCEINPFCQKVLKKHWPDVPIFDDILTLNKEVLDNAGITGIDIVAGGYPCQPYSTAGERKGEDDDRALWPEMCRIISEIRPAWVIGENVAGHISLGLDNVLSDLDSIGYAAQPFIIPAAAVNAKHKRDRVFTVAHPKGKFTRGLPFREEKKITRFSVGSKNVCNSASKRLPDWSGGTMEQPKTITEFERPSGREVERNFCGVAYGVSRRVDRLKSLGNAVVPAQIIPILAAIKELGT